MVEKEGAEAKVYSCRFMGIDSVVKERIKKDYRTETLDTSIRQQRTKKEARILAVAARKGIAVPSLLLAGQNKIVMTKIDGSLLSELLAVDKKKVLDAVFRQAGTLAAQLHALGINHGDLTPANFIIDRNDKVWAIDFGLSDTSNSMEEFALDLLLMKRSIPKKEYETFLQSYLKSSGKKGEEILKRLREIELRGRYQTRTLLTG